VSEDSLATSPNGIGGRAPNHNTTLLDIVGLSGGYGSSQVLFGIDLTVPEVGTVAVIGRNGAGKTTLLRTLLGHLKPKQGHVHFDGADVTGASPARLARLGIGYVPQDQVVFPTLTVRENLQIGQRALPRGKRGNLDEAFEIFPKLGSRPDQLAGTMSGGERKMVGVARAMMSHPRLLVMDEPTEGVWQGVVDELLDRLKIFAGHAAVLVVEQHVAFALELADQVIVLDRGSVTISGTAAEVSQDPDVQKHLAL
jgi:branched-chain amino acid transport system ATP-binding protein